jgi:hypothetical protein
VRAAVVLLFVALLAHWPHLRLDEWRGTEGRRVQIALEMAQSGDFMVPTLAHEATYVKPPLHYWLLAGIDRIFGHGYLAMRLPALLGWWGLAVLAFHLLARSRGTGAGWIAALGVLLSPTMLFVTASAEIDPLFAALTAGSLLCLAIGVAEERPRTVLAAGCLGGLALLDKGPPYFLFAAGAWLCWWRHRSMRHGLCYFVPLLLLPVLYYAPLLLLDVDAERLVHVVKEESVGRATLFTWEHVKETPEYWLRSLLMLLPLGLWCTWEFRGSRDGRMGPADLPARMCTSAVVLSIVVLTFFPARPTRYLEPNVPLFVFAVAAAVAHFQGQQRQLGRFSRSLLRLLGVFGAATLVASPWLSALLPHAPLLALAFALLPWFVHQPRQLVASCFLLPAIVAWTVGLDVADAWRASGRAHCSVAPVLRTELAARGIVDASDLRSFGHFHGGIIVDLGIIPAGDERGAQVPTSRWVLHECDSVPLAPLAGYVERVRLHVPTDTYVLRERKGR